jgi:hypothetical protein
MDQILQVNNSTLTQTVVNNGRVHQEPLSLEKSMWVVGEGTIATITVEDVTEALECIWRREALVQAPSKWDPLREQMLK